MTAVVHTDAVYHCTVNGGLYMLETGMWERNTVEAHFDPRSTIGFLAIVCR